MRADDAQVGGSHYKDKAITPWQVIESNGMDFFEGTALKYLMRWRDKGGVEDLRKARHYIDKLIEMEAGKAPVGFPSREWMTLNEALRNDMQKAGIIK